MSRNWGVPRRDILPSPVAKTGEPPNAWRDAIRAGMVIGAVFAVLAICLITV